MQIQKSVALGLLVLSALPAHAKQPPNLVPQGWTQEFADKETRTRRFVSPDGRSSLTTRQIFVDRANLRGEMTQIVKRNGEQITYLKRRSSWVAISGYRDGAIFYRKSNLACGGSRWNQVELVYPRESKLEMDAPVTRIARGMDSYATDCN